VLGVFEFFLGGIYRKNNKKYVFLFLFLMSSLYFKRIVVKKPTTYIYITRNNKKVFGNVVEFVF